MVEHDDEEANDGNKEQQVSSHASIIEPVDVERRFDKEKAKHQENGENDAPNHFLQPKGTLHGIRLLSEEYFCIKIGKAIGRHASVCSYLFDIVVAVRQEINSRAKPN